MPDVISPYNSTLRRLANKEIDMENVRVMLLDNTAAFNATHTTLVQVAGAAYAKELKGNGWAAGGPAIANLAVTTVNTSGLMVDGDDVRERADGGPIPAGAAAYSAVAYDGTDADKAPIWFIAFENPRQAGEGTDFLIAWHANGISRVNWSA